MKIITLRDGTKIEVKPGRLVDTRNDWVAILVEPDLNTEMLIPILNIQHIKIEN